MRCIYTSRGLQERMFLSVVSHECILAANANRSYTCPLAAVRISCWCSSWFSRERTCTPIRTHFSFKRGQLFGLLRKSLFLFTVSFILYIPTLCLTQNFGFDTKQVHNYLLLSAVKVSVQQPCYRVLMNSSVNNSQWQQFPTLSVFMREIVSFLIKWMRINQAPHWRCVSEEEVITLEHMHTHTHT